ncbi:unnamed protein product, partial [Ectocarpus fasciculatus]
DQILIWVARKIGDILPFVGGPEHAAALIPIFETLCGAEETIVRAAASQSACKVLSKLEPSHNSIALQYLGLLKKLADHESAEVFYARVSAAAIVPDVYRTLSDPADLAAVVEVYSSLSRDDMTIVRRGAALSLPKLAEFASAPHLANEVFQFLKLFISDDCPPVQIAGTSAVSAVVKMMKSKECSRPTGDIVAIVKACVEDHSWKTRTSIAQNYSVFATCFDEADIRAEVFPLVGTLLLDPETDIRVLAALAAVSFVDVVGVDEYLKEIVPVCQQLSDDDAAPARKAVADLVVDSAVKVGQDAAAAHLSPLIIKFIGDADPMVRIRIIAKLPAIVEKLPQVFNRLTTTLQGLFSDSNWRVKKQLILGMPAVVKHMGQAYFLEQFLQAYLVTFKDAVSETREAAAEVLPVICHATDESTSWVHERVFPTVKTMATDEYLLRVTMLGAVKALMQAENLTEVFAEEVIGLIIGATADAVPNIRLRAAETMAEVVKKTTVPPAILERIRPVIAEMAANDKDKDVKYYAAEALKSL